METINSNSLFQEDAICKKIVDAAITIIQEEGFENLTIRKVAKISGCSNSAIYMRFNDKDSLGNAVSSLLAKPFLQAIRDNYLQGDDFLDNLQRISAAALDIVYQMDLGAVFMQLRYRGEQLFQSNNAFITAFEDYIKEAVLNSEIVTTNARMLAITYETSFWGLAYMCKANSDISRQKALEILQFHNQLIFESVRKKKDDDLLWDGLRRNGVDVDKALERLKGNKAAYHSFLIEFFDDPDFTSLQESIDNHQVVDAFEFAHGLKGMAANLGLDQIYGHLSELVEILRTKTIDGAQEAYASVLESCDVIKELL